MDILLAFILALGLVLIAQILRSVLLRPVQARHCNTAVVLYAQGDGASLEQCVRSARLLAERGGVPFLLSDAGLTAEGRAVAERLAGEYGFQICDDCTGCRRRDT